MTGDDDHDGASDESAMTDEREHGESSPGSREPLGGLRDRVVEDGEAETPPTLFPEESTASAAGGDGHDASTASEAGGDDEAASRGEDATASDDGVGASDDGPRVPEEGRDGPLGDLAAGIDGRRERQTKTDEELFDEVDVGELDADELWAQVEADEPTVEPRGEREVREVQKRKYCSQCEYFADPPEVGCSHEGTDILEQVDMEHFKVADCPVVLEDERLEDVTTE